MPFSTLINRLQASGQSSAQTEWRISEGKGNYNKQVLGVRGQVLARPPLATLAALVSVPTLAKGVKQGLETGFGPLLGIYQRVDFSVRLFFEPAKLGHADAHQLLKAAHALLEALVTSVHTGIEPVHAGFSGRLAFCHTFQDGVNLLESFSNGVFHT